PFQFSFVLLQLLFILRVNVDDFELTFDARRPRLRIGYQRYRLRFDYLSVKTLEAPSAPERPPRLKLRVLKSPFGEFVASPLVGAFHIRRSRQTRPYNVGQEGQSLHHL